MEEWKWAVVCLLAALFALFLTPVVLWLDGEPPQRLSTDPPGCPHPPSGPSAPKRASPLCRARARTG